MAASDPATDVPTPTGTLQGVAAFSWDGSAWQPAGLAGPSVATPTGVLRGVAAFNGGPAWQPAGQAGPGVSTPSGTLDGVAVYTWSGSAWTPPGGTATPSTPSGALRGVAAFNWDGAAWQPTGQSGPSVATPYGVLDGVAMFNWNGSAWAAGGAPSLDLSFMTPGTLDPRITFTRASTATYFDATGTMQTAAANAPRWDYDPVTHVVSGLLIEEQRTNLVPSSLVTSAGGWFIGSDSTLTAAAGIAPDATNTMAKLAEAATTAQHSTSWNNVIITAGQMYTMSVYAKAVENRYLQLVLDDNGANGTRVCFDLQTGTISGPASPSGTVTITGAAIQAVGGGIYRCSLATTVGTVSTTARLNFVLSNVAAPATRFPPYLGVAGSGVLLWGAQLELGAFPTSYIPTTAAAVTRAQDQCSVPPANMGWFTSPGGSWAAEFIYFSPTPNGNRVIGRPDVAAGAVPIYINVGLNSGQYDGAASMSTVNIATAVNAIAKGASTWAPGQARQCTNGGTIASAATLATGYGIFTTTGIKFLGVNSPTATENMSGYIRRVRYWPRVLSNAEMQAVTT